MSRRLTRCLVASFDSTHNALRAESICHRLGIAGRIIPTPVSIRADCGLAWSMPPEQRSQFEDAAQGHFAYSGLFELEL